MSGDYMVIYADVLIFSNTVIDYALLLITSTILKAQCKTWRIITGSIIGGISTLYILLENNLLIVDLLVKLCIGFLITIITFGNRNFKILIFSYVIFLLISFSFNGLVMFLQMYFSETFVSNNLVYYINISPIFLILLTALFYMIIKTIQKYCVEKII